MSSSSWWAKKLATEPSEPSRVSTPPMSAPPAPRVAPVPPMTPKSAPNVQVTGENFAEASTMWQGGEATRTEVRSCPNCGSNLYFSRSNSGSSVAPRCYECGYTEGRPMQGVPGS